MEMKDVILRIIFANLGNKLESTPHFTSAREIAEMMSEFIEWRDRNIKYSKRDKCYIHYYSISGFFKYQSLDELFTYWKENIKKQ